VMAAHKGNAAWVVNEISNSLLGKTGGILALLGVVAAPITSGDTAFRSARLIIADFLKFAQGPVKNRLMVTVPLFAAGFVITQIDFAIIWRYMAWSNQTLATIVLWAITIYLVNEKKAFVITLIPAVFMTAVISSYILVAPEGLQLPLNTGLITGFLFTALMLAWFLVFIRRSSAPGMAAAVEIARKGSRKDQ